MGLPLRCIVLLLTVAAGCAHGPATAPSAASSATSATAVVDPAAAKSTRRTVAKIPGGPLTETSGSRAPLPGSRAAAVDIEKALLESGLPYATVEPGRRWLLSFAGKRQRILLYVVRGDEYTLVLGKLFTAGKDAGLELYRSIARRNYDYHQLKLSVDTNGAVFGSFEVPTRILDRQELLEDIFSLAAAIDSVGPELLLETPDETPEDDDEDDEVMPTVLPAAPLIEASLSPRTPGR